MYDIKQEHGPNHVAIIMDGNGRWAKLRGQPRLYGHRKGAKRIRSILKTCPKFGIKYLTIFAFSTENWKRTQEEIVGLMSLFKHYILKETENLRTAGVRVRFIGDRVGLEKKLVHLMDNLENTTRNNHHLNLTIALNYGGRDEVARAAKRLASDLKTGKLTVDNIDEKTFPKYLDTYVLPDPDLVIRTSGEARISNFLLWQSAYAEYEFVHTLWPDFSIEDFSKAILRFKERTRRYGGVNV